MDDSSYKANQQRGTSSSIFGPADSTSAAPTTSPRYSKNNQSSIKFGTNETPVTTTTAPRTSKTSQSSVSFGGQEPPKSSPKITPTHQSQVFSDAPAPAVPTPKMTNKSLVSTINLSDDNGSNKGGEGTASTPTGGRARPSVGGNTTIVIG